MYGGCTKQIKETKKFVQVKISSSLAFGFLMYGPPGTDKPGNQLTN